MRKILLSERGLIDRECRLPFGGEKVVDGVGVDIPTRTPKTTTSSCATPLQQQRQISP
eukprot:m.269802 g.269802  ORF g.269802 m.269802 type:complete len:58 (+) comp43869_c0_seq1:240-413(+)